MLMSHDVHIHLHRSHVHLYSLSNNWLGNAHYDVGLHDDNCINHSGPVLNYYRQNNVSLMRKTLPGPNSQFCFPSLLMVLWGWSLI